MRDEYSESELEELLILELPHFLLELGNEIAFVGRQQRLRIGEKWCRIDLWFFHRGMRCLVIVDLKVGKFTHADAGQMFPKTGDLNKQLEKAQRQAMQRAIT